MDDVTEGGGRATGTAIADGSSNAIFPDISELDRAYGRVNLRKTFVSVATPDTDGYYGANVIVAQPPADPRVSCALFSTGSGFDHRSDAQNRLESYVIAGPLSNMILYGTQNIGQRAIVVYQRQELALPQIGDVLALSLETQSGITVTVVAQQFVRITTVDSIVATFEDEKGTFEYRVITLGISSALTATYTGLEPMRILSEANLSGSAKVRRTSVADASTYYGISALAEAATTGALTVKASSIYTNLVPSSTIETPIALGEIPGAVQVIASGPAITEPNTVWGSAIKTLYLRGGITPRSVTFSNGATTDYWPKTDDGAGNIVLASGSIVGTIDYANGVITPDLTQTTAWSGTLPTIAYTPGTRVSQSAFTSSIPITLATRGQVYVKTLSPIPAPGTLTVSFLAMGTWYTLTDNGAGVLTGYSTADGTGTISYITGSSVVTLGALPDVGSAVMLSWGSQVDTAVHTTGASGFFSTFTLAQGSATRSSLTVHLTKGGVSKTLTDSGTGVLSGDGVTGTINYLTGVIVINDVHDQGTPIEVLYEHGTTTGVPATSTETFTSIVRGGDLTLSVGLTANPIQKTVKVSWPVYMVSYGAGVAPGRVITTTVTVTDDGAGSLKKADGTTVGTVNYSTGIINFLPDTSINYPVGDWTSTPPTGIDPTYTYAYNGQSVISCQFAAAFDVAVTVSYQAAGSVGTTTAADETFSPNLVCDLVPNSYEAILPNGVIFVIGTDIYIDRSGVLYRNTSYITGSGTDVGVIDYSTSRISLTTWPTSPTITVKSCLGSLGGRSATTAAFRTAGAPIRVSSVYVQATSLDGDLITGTSNTGGTIAGTKMKGVVDYVTGVVYVSFGEMVTAAGNESKWWYDARNIVSGNIWKPVEVFPATIKYNAVVVSSMPLDASIIGLDPVRLPSDGRVPIFRSGGVVVVHHTTVRASQTVSNGQTVDVGRTRLSRLTVTGNDGVVITAGYTVNLDAGTVTFSSVAGYSQPVVISHRIEDMALVSDAQISGDLSLTRQLTHDFPLGSYASSALIIGDMHARVSSLFDQATWASTWLDTLSGSAATATFNDVLAPIVVTNAGAITERWVIQFTNTTAFNVIGEHVGVIATGNVSSDCAPSNTAAGAPYFSIPATGWGSGWAAGNVLRFNTIGALYPVWIARTIQQGPSSAASDSFQVLIRGDIDTP
jgi:hypothetical protein